MHVEPQTTSTKSDPLKGGLASSKRATNFDQIAFLLIRSRQILAHDLTSLDKTRWTWNEVRLVFTDTLWGIPLNGRAYLIKISLGTNPMSLVTFANSIMEKWESCSSVRSLRYFWKFFNVMIIIITEVTEEILERLQISLIFIWRDGSV